jgi:hypothetical protein
MRALILVAGAGLAISACNGNETAENVTNVDEDLAAQNIVANDTTSIDAATVEDANMAAETRIDLNELGNGDSANVDDGDSANQADNAT